MKTKFNLSKWICLSIICLVLGLIFTFIFLSTLKFSKVLTSYFVNNKDLPLLLTTKQTSEFVKTKKLDYKLQNNTIYKINTKINQINCSISLSYLKEYLNLHYYYIWKIEPDNNKKLNISELDKIIEIPIEVKNLNLWNYLK